MDAAVGRTWAVGGLPPVVPRYVFRRPKIARRDEPEAAITGREKRADRATAEASDSNAGPKNRGGGPKASFDWASPARIGRLGSRPGVDPPFPQQSCVQPCNGVMRLDASDALALFAVSAGQSGQPPGMFEFCPVADEPQDMVAGTISQQPQQATGPR